MTTSRHGSATFEFTDRAVTTERRFDAPIALVFDALTNPEHVRKWFSADDAPLHLCEIELRVGGEYRFAWMAPGGQECAFRGTYLEIDPPVRIVCSWLFDGWPDDEAVQTTMLTEEDGVTIMTETLEFATPEHLGDHFQDRDGVHSSLDKLEDLLAELQS